MGNRDDDVTPYPILVGGDRNERYSQSSQGFL